MIYSSLKGGLGNMYFEIAAMVSLAYDNNDKVGFINVISQIAYLNNETNFNPNMQHASEYSYFLDKINFPQTEFVQQFSIPFHYTPLQYVNGAFYDGFFQSEKWFKHNRDKVIETFKPSYAISKIVSDKYSHILSLPNTVGVHVRRGDYVKNQQNHAVLSLEYYNQAFTQFESDFNFIIFSDDIAWCKNVFHNKNQHFIENEKDYVEIYLMAALDHCIIANSSFGWWGAWLNTNINKKIIAPSIWFGPNIKHNTADIIPNDWIKI